MTNFKALIPLSAAIAIGILSAGRLALASDSGEDRGGFVLPGSMDGVNPVYHPDIFDNSKARRAYGFAPRHHESHGQARMRDRGGSYAFVPGYRFPARPYQNSGETQFERNWFHYQDCPGTEGGC